MILDNELLTVDDVLIQPDLGRLQSRTHAQIDSFMFSAPMDTVTGHELAMAMIEENQIPVICRSDEDEWITSICDEAVTQKAFFAVGAKPTELARVLSILTQNKISKINLALDIAHGDSVIGYEALLAYRASGICNQIMSGSIATIDAAIRCIAVGCTHLRIGIGPGSACQTRIQTGIGVPQLSAVYLIHKGLTELGARKGITLIADGGIRNSGDAAKYLAAGADAIMLGRGLACTAESLGWQHTYTMGDGLSRCKKSFRGHASADYQNSKGLPNRLPEGVTLPEIEYDSTITVSSVVKNYREGLAGTLSYTGLTNLTDLKPDNVKFLKVTPAGIREGYPHA